jgi:hypothetical protein
MLTTEQQQQQQQQQQQFKLPLEEWLDRAAAHVAAQALRQSQCEQRLPAVQRPAATDTTLRQCCIELLQGLSAPDTDWLPQVQ